MESQTATAVSRTYKRAKIIATIGPSTDDPEMIEKLARAGVNGFRLNFSHGTHEERDKQIPWIRQAAEKVGKPVTIFQDLQGPKIRLGEMEGVVNVSAGEVWNLTYGAETDVDAKRLAIQYDLSQKMKVGEPLFMFDGKVRSEVQAVEPENHTVRVRIENDGIVMKRKGINVPDTDFGGDVLTDKDMKDIMYGVDKDLDYVAISFVQKAAEVEHLRKILRDNGSNARVIVKVETKSAIEPQNLEEIVIAADAVMVARGDLAVEAGAEVVPIVQRDIISLCQKHGRISIVATQMMASMVESASPTRAEVSDVANAVIFGADCLMLSDETAAGRYPLETVKEMKKVILYTQNRAPVQPVYFQEGKRDQQDAISSAVITLAHQIDAAAIICETKTGETARSIASHRPAMPIISVTSSSRVAQQLSILYANKSFQREDGEKAGLALAEDLVRTGFLMSGNTVVLVSGRQPGMAGMTDTIRIRVLE
ncbi:pyruvate kinase [Candidatus Saccharibacteria bacterium]|nr:pyruvate kinase [Candidatus Saccharibacteria bacterium]